MPDWTKDDELMGEEIISHGRALLEENKRIAFISGRELTPSESDLHELHKRVCYTLFKVEYCHLSMKGVRNFISHRASLAKVKKKAQALAEFVKEHLDERLLELQQALHPEDETHLIIAGE